MKLLTQFWLFCLLTFASSPPSLDLKKYPAIESYEIRPGIMITPSYSAKQSVCEIVIERRHRSTGTIDMEAAMPREQILELLDELVPRKERGQPGLGLPDGTEITEVDGGIRASHIAYENISLAMYGRATSREAVVAVITWNKNRCN